ncbi:MAG: RluA family pseudouridine synthase [Peptococcia bacterium]|jgi:23S rRNA pseudouridine1911/1915/1917 synthase
MGKAYRIKIGSLTGARQARTAQEAKGAAGQLRIDESGQGKRIDVYLTAALPDLTRTQVQRLLENGDVLVNGQPVKANYKTKTDDLITYRIPAPKPVEILPEKLPLDIVYEDEDVLVVNKPQGMVVHPAFGNYQGTLVNALLGYGCKLSDLNGDLRPGIVHRIDKETSGLLVVAKNNEAHRELAAQLKKHELKREYLALVHGVLNEPGGIIDAPIGRDLKDRQKMAVVFKNSKPAVTRYLVLERFAAHTLIKCSLETGRTHQIRVHMAYLHHPVVGDAKYGYRKEKLNLVGQVLHAATLGFAHPRSKQWLEFTADIPTYFRGVLQSLGSQYIHFEVTNISTMEKKE